MYRACVVAVVVGLCGCVVESPSEFVPRPELRSATTSSLPDRVWVTMARDEADQTRQQLAIGGLPQLALEPIVVENDIAVMEVAAETLPQLSALLHDRRHRCGGFITHTTRDDAIAAVRATAYPRQLHVGETFTIDNPDGAAVLIAGVSAVELLDTIQGLSAFPTRYHEAASGTEAAVWLRDRWLVAAGDRSDITVELFEHSVSSQPSVVMTIAGTTVPDEQVVIGGHLDSISFSGDAPGADDDASGVAVVGEIGRVIAATNYRPARTITLYAYAAEEVGLLGSAEIANAAATANATIAAVMQLDMTNFRGTADLDMTLISDFTDPVLNRFVGELIDTYVDATWEYDECGYGCSDHASWTRAGFAAVLPAEARTRDINSALHTPGDTLARSGNNVDHSLPFARLAAAFVAEVAKGGVGAGRACSDANPCPSGQVCEASVCVVAPSSPDAGAGPGSDAAPGAGADPNATNPNESGGCGCATAMPHGGSPLDSLLIIGVIVGSVARRRRRREPPT